MTDTKLWLSNWSDANESQKWALAVSSDQDEASADALIEAAKTQTMQQQAASLVEVSEMVDYYKNVVTLATVVRDRLRYEVIPEKMDNEGVQSINIKGLGTLYLSAEVLVSTKQAMGPDLQDWLRENGFEDLITETINASTLGAWVREQMKAGNPVPDWCLNIHPRSRAAVKKS